MSENSLGIERLLVVVNPESTLNKFVKAEIIDVLDDSDWRGRYDIVETSNPEDGQPPNDEEFCNKLRPNMGVIGACGDGGQNEAVNVIDGADDEVRETLHYLSLPYGSGNDTARSLNGGKGRVANFLDILAHGRIRSLDLIDVDLDGESRVAVSYVGLGWTALGSEAINQLKARARKKNWPVPSKLLDAATLSKLLLDTKFRPSFKYSEGDGGVREASEILFSNLPSMAGGVIRVEPSRPGEVVCIEIEPEGFMKNIAKRLATQRFTGGMKGEHISGRTITVESGAVIHFDGEPQKLSEQTEITVIVKPSRIKAIF